MFSRLSRKTIYQRFHMPHPRVPERALASFTRADDQAASLVAVVGGEIVGHAIFVRSDSGREAEFALVVEDRWQSQGVGKLLLSELAKRARQRDVETFTGEVLGENRRVPGGTGEATGSSTQVGQVTEQARRQSQRLAHQARQQASDPASRTTEQAKGQLANQKHNASQRLTPVQTALRETSHQLRTQGQGPVADHVERAADQVERFSTYLRETDVDEIMEEVRSFARRRPGLFLGGGAAMGPRSPPPRPFLR